MRIIILEESEQVFSNTKWIVKLQDWKTERENANLKYCQQFL